MIPGVLPRWVAPVVASCVSASSFILAYYAAGLGTLMSLLVQAVVTGVIVAAEEGR